MNNNYVAKTKGNAQAFPAVYDGGGSLTIDNSVPLEELHQRATSLGEVLDNIGIEFLNLAESFLKEHPTMSLEDAWDKLSLGLFKKAIQDLEERRDRLQLELEQWDDEQS